MVVFGNPVTETISEEKRNKKIRKWMKVIKSKYPSGKVTGAFAVLDQFSWLPLESLK